MTSERKAAANAVNAKLSTGPRTPSGKAKSSRNALKHGLTARRLLTNDEDPDEFENFIDALRDDLAPVGAVESELVDAIISSCWRLRRVDRLETSVIKRGLIKARAEAAEATAGEIELGAILGVPDIDEHDRQRVADERRKAREMRSEAASETAADALSGSGHELLLTSRYRAATEHSIFRAMHELERRQARRAGVAVALPAVLDASLAISTVTTEPAHHDEAVMELRNEPIDHPDAELRDAPIPSDGSDS